MCRVAKVVALFTESEPSVFLLFVHTRFNFHGTPRQYTVAFTVSIYIHLRELRACAEPTPASACRGEATLVNICINILALSSQRSTSQISTGFQDVNALARDQVLHSVWCLLDEPHLARLSRLCRRRPGPCSRCLPAPSLVFVFSSNRCSDSSYIS